MHQRSTSIDAVLQVLGGILMVIGQCDGWGHNAGRGTLPTTRVASEAVAEQAGTLKVEGKTFSTMAEADAYRDLLKMVRR